jgi:hypothetical protein
MWRGLSVFDKWNAGGKIQKGEEGVAPCHPQSTIRHLILGVLALQVSMDWMREGGALDRLPKGLTEMVFCVVVNSCRVAAWISDSGPETPVPALFFRRGCSSAPSSRLGLGACGRGPFGNLFWQTV